MTKKTLIDLFKDQCQKSPNQNAIGWVDVDKVRTLDFESYQRLVETLSLAMGALGIEKNTKVSILSGTRKEWNYLDLAIMSSSAVTVPIYPNYTVDEIQYILEHSEAEFLVIENEMQFRKIQNHLGELKLIKKIISIDSIPMELRKSISDTVEILTYEELMTLGATELAANPDKFDALTAAIQETDIATIVYTSGTTGRPKGAIIEHKALFQMLSNIKKFSRNAFGKNDSLLTFLPLAHVLGRCESFFPITFGCMTVYTSELDNILEEINIVRPTLMVGVPRFFEKIYEGVLKRIEDNPVKLRLLEWANSVGDEYFDAIDNDKSPKTKTIIEFQLARRLAFDKIYESLGGRIRYFISGGAALDTKVNKFLRNTNLTVLEGYGLTETIGPCFVNPLNKQIPGTVGQPLGDVEVNIAEDGEIILKTHALFKEYLKDQESTSEVFNKEGWFLTGDIGHIDHQGFLHITDRKKDIIITSGGKNIAPGKIEALLKRSQYILTPIVVGEKRKHLTALIEVDLEALRPHFEGLGIDDGVLIEDLAENSDINNLISHEINLVNEHLATFETIKKFRIIPVSIGEHNYLTPSLKVKRSKIERDFEGLIDAMYQQ